MYQYRMMNVITLFLFGTIVLIATITNYVDVVPDTAIWKFQTYAFGLVWLWIALSLYWHGKAYQERLRMAKLMTEIVKLMTSRKIVEMVENETALKNPLFQELVMSEHMLIKEGPSKGGRNLSSPTERPDPPEAQSEFTAYSEDDVDSIIGVAYQLWQNITNGMVKSRGAYAAFENMLRFHKKINHNSSLTPDWVGGLEPVSFVLEKAEPPRSDVCLTKVGSWEGPHWAIYDGAGNSLGVDGIFMYEPQPSSRSDEYLKAHRFDTVADAMKAWGKYVRIKRETEIEEENANDSEKG